MSSEGKNSSKLLGADTLKLFLSLGAAALFLFGYSYSTTYFRGFGLSPAEVDIDFVQGIATGAFLVRHGIVFFVGLLIVTSITIITLWIRPWIRERLGQEWFYMFLLIVFVCVCYGAIAIGVSIATSHLKLIASGKAGKIMYCALKEDAKFPEEFVERFNDLTHKSKVRKIHETDHAIYLSFALDVVPENFTGHSIMFSKRDVAYCRVIGQ